MCSGLEQILMAVSTGLQVVGQLSRGQQQQDWGEWQAEQARADAQAAREEGEVRGERIKKLAKRQQSEARAALAAAGVETGAGTAVVIDRQIGRDAEADAEQERLAGLRRGVRYEQEGEAASIQGRNAATGSMLAAGATLATGWRPSRIRVNDPTNYRDS
jgi:hypothetical protein